MKIFKLIYLAVFLIFSSWTLSRVWLFSLNLADISSATDYFAFYSRNNFLQKEEKFLRLVQDETNRLMAENKDFVEADLEEMKIRIFKNGKIQKELPILAKGDPQSWGGTAAGVYDIKSGNKVSFSNISQVYMPYALHYFGKYYIHGEPYYPGGEKMVSDVSGGCLRLKDSDAEILFEETEIGMPLVVVDRKRDEYRYPPENISISPKISAEAFLTADLDSGYVFLSKEENIRYPLDFPARLMQALTISEAVNLEKSALSLAFGRKLRVVELFYLLLADSTEKDLETSTSFLGKKRTLELMNAKAKSILMPDDSFPSIGKSELALEDLFQLARNISNNRDLIWKISRGKKVPAFGGISLDLKKMKNANLFVGRDDFIGGQADEKAGLFIFSVKNRNILIVLYGSENLSQDVLSLHSWILENYFE